MSQFFCYHCVEYIKLDTCTKFHDHRSNKNKVMMGVPLLLTVQKGPCQIGLRERSLSMAHIGAEEIPMGMKFFQTFCIGV